MRTDLTTTLLAVLLLVTGLSLALGPIPALEQLAGGLPGSLPS
ncbi:MAG: hypothetical protein QGG40_06045 [Myxococcota bacterium]|jgi:hypothetical protein|nr:hypothetical protein [Myxococcota bacterium]